MVVFARDHFHINFLITSDPTSNEFMVRIFKGLALLREIAVISGDP
jgi:hypothetical protein